MYLHTEPQTADRRPESSLWLIPHSQTSPPGLVDRPSNQEQSLVWLRECASTRLFQFCQNNGCQIYPCVRSAEYRVCSA